MKKIKTYIIVFWAFQFCNLIIAQNQPINFGHLTIEDGLSHNTISKITQDTKGFMWFTTYDGLNRYDGKNFEVFRHEPKDTSSLSGNSIWGLEASRDGSIWIGASNALNRYDYESNNFQRIQLAENPNDSYSIRDIKEDAKGNIWVATLGNGLFKVSRSKTQSVEKSTIEFDVENFLHDPKNENGLPSNSIAYIALDPIHDHIIWLSCFNHIIRLDTNTGIMKNVLDFDKLGYDANGATFTQLVATENNTLWIGTGMLGLLKYNLETNSVKLFLQDESDPNSIAENRIDGLLMDHKGNLWISIFGRGISILVDEERGFFKNYSYDPEDPMSLSINNVLGFFLDDLNNIWISTNGGGINYHNTNQFSFQALRSIVNDKNSLCSNQLRLVFEDNQGNSWTSSSVNGINIFKLDTVDYNIVENRHIKRSPDGMIEDLSSHSICQINDGSILLGRRTSGVIVYDLKKNEFRTYLQESNDLKEIQNTIVFSILEQTNNDLLFGTRNGLYMYNYQKREVSLIYHIDNDKDFTINYLYEDTEGKIYMCTPYHGLHIYNPTDDSVVIRTPQADSKRSIGSTHILSFHASSEECYWFGTWGGGLSKYNPQQDTFYTFDKSDGLINNTIYSIQEDEFQNIWLSTNKGLIMFDQKNNAFKNFDLKCNIQGEEYNSRVGFTNKDGLIYFGGMNGLNVFDPRDVFFDTISPKLFWTELVRHQNYNGENIIIEEKRIFNTKEITLYHKDKIVRFGFSALKIPELLNYKYEYILEGFNSNWIDLKTQSSITFTNLSQGEYNLRIKLSSINNDWKDQEMEISLRVLPPWWKTWWAYMIYTFAIFFLLFAVYNYRISQLVKYQTLRTKISSNLHDDVGTILTTVAMQSEILGIDAPEEKLSRYENLSALSREALARMRDTVWAIDSRKDNVDSLIDRMEDFLLDIIVDDRIEVSFNHSESRNSKLAPDVRQNLYLIFKEAITNIVKYSNGDLIIIDLKLSKGDISLTIQDNGIVDSSKLRTSGTGISNMKMRSEQIGLKFSIDTSEGFKVIIK